MDSRSPKIQELRCMWGLFSILESCQGHPDHKLISNGRSVNKHTIDYPRKSFDEECRRIQKEAGLRGVPVDARAKTSGNFDEENVHIDVHKSKRTIVKRREHIKMDSELDRVAKTQKRERKHQVPSTSPDISLNKLTIAAILEAAACAQNPHEEIKLSEYIHRSNHLGKYGNGNQIHFQQVRMRAKDFVDQMLLDRKFISKEEVSSETKSDKIVILKPAPRNAKHSENVSSLLQDRNKSSKRVSDPKTMTFSFREMKRRLKHTFGVSRKEQSLMVGNSEKLSQECFCGGVDIMESVGSSTNSETKKDHKPNMGSDIARETDGARKKLDFSRVNKKECDVILEAKRHLSARLRNINSLEGATSKKSPKTLQRVLSSPEHDFWPLSPHNTSLRATESSSQVSNGRESAHLSPLRSNNEEDGISTTDDTKSSGESDILETDSILHPDLHVSEDEPSEVRKCDITKTTQVKDAIKRQKDEDATTHSTPDSLAENGATASTGDDFPSSPFSIYKLDMANTIKCHEEHQSPDSVLEPFFVEDADSPPSTTHQSAKKQQQPRRLDFEECSFESTPHNSYMEYEDHLMQYVQLVLQASNLNWDHLSQISHHTEELLHESLFEEVELPPLDCFYDPKLLFDHINEVLMEIYKCHCCSPYRLPLITRPRIMSTPLVEVVLDEIMTEAEFYLLPTTEKRTLDQIVSRDVAECRSWPDVWLDTERIVIGISEDVLVENILDIVLEFTL